MTSIFDAELWDVGKFKLKEVMIRPLMVDIINGLDFDELYYAPCSMRTGHFTCRAPKCQGTGNTRRWHDDCEGAQQFIAIWTTSMPTEMWHKASAQEMTLETNRLYLFNNSKWLHRMPKGAGKDKDRWFVRYNIYTRRFNKPPM